MTDLLAIAMFLLLIATVYVVLLSDHGIPTHRFRVWQERHEQMGRDRRALSNAREGRSRAEAGHPPDSKVIRDRK